MRRATDEQICAGELAGGEFDLPSAACRALEALPRIEAQREHLATLSGTGPFRLEHMDALADHALTAAHAHARCLAATDLDELLEQAVRRGHELRELLLAHTAVLALHGIVDAATARSFPANHGYQAVAAELLALVRLWNGVWPQLEGRTLLTSLQLIEAEYHADQLLVAVSALGHDFDESDLERVRLERERAQVAFVVCYSAIRAALTFLFHKEDSGVTIAPALTPRDKRSVRLAQLERAMTYTPRDEWDPTWEEEFDRLYHRSSK